MAVHTDVSEAELAGLLTDFELVAALDFAGADA